MDNESYLNSLPENIKKLDVSNRGLTFLDVTRFKNLETLNCVHNHLTSLYLNENLKILHCFNNKLSSLNLNKDLKELYCFQNQLTSLHLNKNLEILSCGYNHLTSLSLHLNKNLKILYCDHNNLSFLHLNDNLETIDYYDNPIYEIINSDDKNTIKNKVKILNNFRYLYYCLKFKKQFRNLL